MDERKLVHVILPKKCIENDNYFLSGFKFRRRYAPKQLKTKGNMGVTPWMTGTATRFAAKLRIAATSRDWAES